MKDKSNHFPVSVIVPMRDSATTLLLTLKSIEKQKYPVDEIIIIDNVSSDNSVVLANGYKKKSKIPITIVQNKVNNGVGSSYNRGVKLAKAEYVVFMHSDSSLDSVSELEKLTQPFRNDKNTVGSYPYVVLPEKVWETYNFWQKCLFARSVGASPGFNGKFDCIRKKAFLKVRGFDELTYGRDTSIGGEDADLYLRLEEQGKMVLSIAEVIHLHYLGNDYALSDWVKNRKLLARTYGRLLRFQGLSLPLSTSGKGLQLPLGMFVFMIKPALAILPFFPFVHKVGIAMILLYVLFNSRKIYTTLSTLRNPRIFLLPFIDIFLLYYEVFWMIESFLFMKRKV